MSAESHLADVPAQQGARERRLAGVRMRDEAEGDGGHAGEEGSDQ
jgi:hypothetical protein